MATSISGHGVHHFWGFSSALDAQEIYNASLKTGDASGGLVSSEIAEPDMRPLRVLLLAPSDPRSVLKTISQRFRHGERPVHVRV